MRLTKLFALVSPALVVAACSDTPAPAGTIPGTDAGADVSVPATPTVDAGDPPKDATATEDAKVLPATIGAAGGEVSSSDGAASIKVPAGALKAEAPIAIATVGASTDKNIGSSVFNFTPNGLKFEQDAEICITVPGTVDTSKACLGYLDEAKSPAQWRCEDACLSKKDKGGATQLCGSTNHFTNFAILLGGGSGASDKCSDAYITGAGGSFLSADKGASLTIAPGVLTAPQRFTITEIPNPTAEQGSLVYEFSPDGSKFAKKVSVCVKPTAGKKTDNACLGFLNAEKKWECVDECLESKGDLLCGDTDHFTNFAILLTGGKGTSCTN